MENILVNGIIVKIFTNVSVISEVLIDLENMLIKKKDLVTVCYYITISVGAIIGLFRYSQWKKQKMYDILHMKYCEVFQNLVSLRVVLHDLAGITEVFKNYNTIDFDYLVSENKKIIKKREEMFLDIEKSISIIDIYFEKVGLKKIRNIKDDFYDFYDEYSTLFHDVFLENYILMGGTDNNISNKSQELSGRILNYIKKEYFDKENDLRDSLKKHMKQ